MPRQSERSRPKKATRKKAPAKQPRRWSNRVTETSNALDLEKGIFRLASARRIAASLKRSADESLRRRTDPFRSAMSMLNFYINRGGKNLSRARKQVLNRAKRELRSLFGRPAPRRSHAQE